MKILIIASLFVTLLTGGVKEDCRGKMYVETKPGRLIYGCVFKAVARVDLDTRCEGIAVYSRLRVIGKYDSGWTRGMRKVSPIYITFVAGTVDVVFEWICIECGSHGKIGKRFPIGG
jgi:hypothetical protein